MAALTGVNLLNYVDRQVLAAVLTPIKAEFNWSDARLGFLGTAFMLGYFLTAPVFGYLGDRISRKGLIAAGVLVWSLGTVLSGSAGAYWDLVLFRVLVGLGEASYGTISPGWIADVYAPGRRNNALSVFYAAIPAGSALGYLAGGLVAARYGWRPAFYMAGAPGLILALFLLRLREPERGATDPNRRAGADVKPSAERPAAAFAGYASLLRIRPYVLVVAGYVAQTFALGAFSFWAPTFLCRVHGMSVRSAGLFFGESLVITGLAATLLGGFAATAWQRRTDAGYARLMALSAAVAVPFSFAAFCLPDPAQAKAALVASMFFIFLPTGPVNTLILGTVPTALRATAMAASIFAIHLFGDLESPNLVGLLSDALGGDLQKAVLWTLPAAILVGAIFWGWLAIAFPCRQAPIRPDGAGLAARNR